MSVSADIVITTVTSIFILTCIVGNCILCAVVRRNRDMRIPINYLLLNLAVGDIVYSTFTIPTITLSHNVNHPNGVTGRVLCALITGGNIAWVGADAAVVTLIAIAIERYFSVVYPYGNKGKLTMRKLKVIIPGSWIVGLIVQFPAFLDKIFVKKHNSCLYSEKWTKQVVYIVFYVYGFFTCTLLVVVYSRVIYTLWFKRNDDLAVTHQQQGVLKVRKRVTLMVVTVSAIFVISWGSDAVVHVLDNDVGSIKLGPYVIPIVHAMVIFVISWGSDAVVHVLDNDVGSIKLGPYVIPIVHAMVMFNSAVNPYAYALINQRFREKMKRMICCNSSVAPAREPQGIEMLTPAPSRLT